MSRAIRYVLSPSILLSLTSHQSHPKGDKINLPYTNHSHDMLQELGDLNNNPIDVRPH